MYEKIVDARFHKQHNDDLFLPVHYSMGGTWVDYNLMTNG